jgi:tRNA(adenine34) deaminase
MSDAALPPPAICEAAMRLALAEARRALAAGELPYGAVVVSADGTPVAECHDTVAASGDPTRHAEFDAVRAAIAQRGDLASCLLVSTVEPCAMCAAAAWYGGIATIGYGISMAELKALRPDALEEPLGAPAALFRPLARRPRIVPGVLREDCLALWRP